VVVRPGRTRWILLASLAALVLVAGAIWGFVGSGAASGDPGGEVMNQLSPAVTTLPGYGTAALPWVSRIPGSLDASYMIKMEPSHASCSGTAGTEGSNQVVVQAGFKWKKGFLALVSYMDPRLSRLGWAVRPPPDPSSPPIGEWTKTLSNGTRANLGISEERLPVWQLVATADSIAKAASGCGGATHPGGDPRGSMLRTLGTTEKSALIPNSHIDSIHSYETKWLDGNDACDGVEGWLPVQSDVTFTSSSAPALVVSTAESALEAQGWVGVQNPDEVNWTRTAGGEKWYLILARTDPVAHPRQWSLYGRADPKGPQANTC